MAERTLLDTFGGRVQFDPALLARVRPDARARVARQRHFLEFELGIRGLLMRLYGTAEREPDTNGSFRKYQVAKHVFEELSVALATIHPACLPPRSVMEAALANAEYVVNKYRP